MYIRSLSRLLHGAACGLAHVHSCGKVHGDVKPSNVLIVPNDTDGDTITFTAKIADFGFTVGKTRATNYERLASVSDRA